MFSHLVFPSQTTASSFILFSTSTPLSAVAKSFRRKQTPWLNSIKEQFCELRRKRREAERRWFKSKLTIHKQIYDSIKENISDRPSC